MDYLMKVQESLKYIEENLTNSISLDTLAKQAYFSTYYFHRLFQSIVGEPVMEYVRRKRLLHAAEDLLYCDYLSRVLLFSKFMFLTLFGMIYYFSIQLIGNFMLYSSNCNWQS